MRLSPHFTLTEFACKDGTPYPEAWRETRLPRLVALLEAIRVLCGDRAITITSGYRTTTYNRQIGGARNSQHVQGLAADIRVAGLAPAAVHQRALEGYQVVVLPLLGGLGCYRGFTHVDVRQSTPKRLAHWSG